MEKIILFQIEEDKEIASIASNMRIKVIKVPKEKYRYPLNVLAQEKESPLFSKYEGDGLSGSIILFCDVTDKHLDRFLFEMRKRQIKVDYKAVMTQANQSWDAVRLSYMLEAERREINTNF